MAATQHGVLVEGTVSTALSRMAVPMALGTVSMVLVNVIDTFWVARLGTDFVAAMTYTFPVVGLIINLALGIMIGTSTAVARAIGGGYSERAGRLTTHALIFAMVAVVGVSLLGVLSQDVLFRTLGASGRILKLTKEYMTIWYLGVVFLMVPLIANGALRASGDAKTPMRVMMLGAAINAILDPAFIYGFGPIPALGLKGAAIATLIARFVGMLFVFWVLVRNTQLLQFKWPQLSGFLDSMRTILSVGAPAAVTNAVGPVAVGLMTAIVAQYGEAGLAAYGIGARVDALILMVPMAVGGALSPFVGQNWGAHLLLRVADGIRISIRFGLIWGLCCCLLVMFGAHLIGGIFTDDQTVLENVRIYFYTMPIGYAFIAITGIASSAFNAVDRAIRSTWLSLLRSLVLAVPAAYLGGYLAGLRGVFFGLVFAYISSALLGARWLRDLLQPDGELSPEKGTSLSVDESKHMMKDASLGASLGAVLTPIFALEGMVIKRLSGGVVGFFVGQRELGHLHDDGRLDLPLPVEIGENLVRRGVVIHHPAHDDNGWYSHHIRNDGEVSQTVWLMQLAHLLYEVSRRGIHDPITQAEIDAFSASENCIKAMVAATERWSRCEQGEV